MKVHLITGYHQTGKDYLFERLNPGFVHFKMNVSRLLLFIHGIIELFARTNVWYVFANDSMIDTSVWTTHSKRVPISQIQPNTLNKQITITDWQFIHQYETIRQSYTVLTTRMYSAFYHETEMAQSLDNFLTTFLLVPGFYSYLWALLYFPRYSKYRCIGIIE